MYSISESVVMKFFKIALSYSFLLMGFVSSSFSSPIHIAVLEDPTFIEEAPFASRVNVLVSSELSKDEEFKEHGVAVCSVLVGRNSLLPKDTSITLVPTLKQFSSYISTQNPNDLVILNWSGSIGCPGLPEEVVDDLDNMANHIKRILRMKPTEFTAQVGDYIEAYDDMLRQLPQDGNPVSELLSHAKESLLKAAEHPNRIEEDRDSYISGISEKIETFKKYAEEKAKLRFNEMKTELLESLRQHDNTLIVWALGNDGECIDTNPFWKGVLGDELILSHTILVHGLQINGRKDVGSNFTKFYSDHTLGKPYRTEVWNAEKSRYVYESGTSFSAPLVTMDAFIKAKEMLDQTGQTPVYADVKRALLMK